MTISRRWFMAGMALTGAALPAAFYAHRELTREEFPITPGEATVDLADTAGQQLADNLRGVWDIRFSGSAAGLDGLPRDGLELFLDIAHRGRGLRGFLDTGASLRSEAPARYQVIGDLAPGTGAEMYWRLMRTDAPHAPPVYEFKVKLDEVWAAFGNAGSGTFTGQVLRLDRPLALPELDNHFIAIKRRFPEARERTGLNPTLLAWLVAPEHRLFHQLWHASRDKWHKLSEKKRDALRGIGWQPGPRDKERDARGPSKDRNGSGIDFFFMHRHMLGKARSMQDLPSWQAFPMPQPELERDRQGFARYFDNHDGDALPPTWLTEGDDEYTKWVSDIKAAETYHSNFQCLGIAVPRPALPGETQPRPVRLGSRTGPARLVAHALGVGGAGSVQRHSGADGARSGGFCRALVCAGKRLSRRPVFLPCEPGVLAFPRLDR